MTDTPHASSWRTRLADHTARAPEGFRSLVTPVYRGSTTLFTRSADVRDTWDHDEARYTYGLYGTPTTLELAARIAELEGGERTFITPGGQSALALVYLAFLGPGDHVLVPASVYGPSRAMADDVLHGRGVDVEYYAPDLGAGIAARLRPTTRLVWCESPGSVTMDVQDVPAICAAAHARGVPVALDNTWAAGILFDAFAHGVDVSIQAVTKYIGGHSDIIVGSVTLRDATHYQRVGVMHQHLGLAASPSDCALALRGLQTLAVRLDAIERGALEVARSLLARPEIARVLHPALPSCSGHALWQRDFRGSSGLFSVLCDPAIDRARAHAFVDALRLFAIGYSWGGITSLAVPFDMSARHYQPFVGQLVRLSIGLETPADLIADLHQALDAASGRRSISTNAS